MTRPTGTCLKQVIITGLPDGLNDEDREVRIQFAPASSNDPSYSGQQVPDFLLTNVDQDASTATGLEVSELIDLNDILYFAAKDPVVGWGLWKTTGSSSGVALVAAFGIQPVRQLTSVGNRLYFTASTAQHGEELWQSEGTAGTTVRVTDIVTGRFSSDIRQLTEVGPGLRRSPPPIRRVSVIYGRPPVRQVSHGD